MYAGIIYEIGHMKKLVFLMTLLSSITVKADALIVSLMCFEESDFNNTTLSHDPLIVDVKNTDDNMGYAVAKYISKNNGNVRHGLTYFKADAGKDDNENPNVVLFTTRQNPEDLGKDADFLGIDFTDYGTKDAPLYRAVEGRGHDDISKKSTGYFCGLNK